jgi:hypothetical protein
LDSNSISSSNHSHRHSPLPSSQSPKLVIVIVFRRLEVGILGWVLGLDLLVRLLSLKKVAKGIQNRTNRKNVQDPDATPQQSKKGENLQHNIKLVKGGYVCLLNATTPDYFSATKSPS